MDASAGLVTRPPRMKDYFPALDGIRGIAVLWVMSFHFSDWLAPVTLLERAALGFFKAGWVGLEAFFVLSGYLITGILYDTRNTRSYLPTFYARRFLRVFPLYYGFLFGMVLFVEFFHPSDRGEARAFVDKLPWYWGFLVNGLVGVNQRWNVAPYNTSHFWSLSLEEQFYVFWPALMMLGDRRRLLWITGSVFFGSVALRAAMHAAGVHGLTIFVFTPARLDALAAGSFLALAARGPDGFKPLLRFMEPLGYGCGAVLLTLLVLRGRLLPSDVWVQIIGLPVMACLSIVLVVAIVTRPDGKLDRFLKNRVLVFLGTYSYGIYVFHFPMVIAMQRWGITFALFYRLTGSQLVAQLFFYVSIASASIALALASFHLFEKHFLRFKNRYYPLRAA